MSDVEKYWNAVRAKFGNNRAWQQLNPQEQMAVIQSINIMIAVLNNR